jgi:hypothetical protein
VFALFGLATCGGSAVSYTTACSPGRSVACVGPGACTGYQVCKGDGSGFGPCSCGLLAVDGGQGADSGRDGAVDVANRSDGSLGDGSVKDSSVSDTNVSDTNVSDTNVSDTRVSDSGVGDSSVGDSTSCDDPGEIVCGGGCVNAQTDAANCGACGHSCIPGACSGGVCQPFTLANDPAGIGVLVVLDGRATWGNYITGEVRTCTIDSCSPTNFAPGTVTTGCAMDSQNIYWAEQIDTGNVTQCAIGSSCGSPTTLASSQSQPWYVVSDSQNVYWTDFVGGTVMMCAIGGCGGNPTVIASGLDSPLGLAVDSNNLYWTNFSSSGSVMQCAKGGPCSTPTTLASAQGSPYGITVDSENVYWANQGGDSVMSCAIGGCGENPLTLASGQSGATLVAVDSTDIYWTDAFAGTVMRCSLPGCGSMTTIASGQQSAFSIALDATRVYWGNQGGGQVMGVAK